MQGPRIYVTRTEQYRSHIKHGTQRGGTTNGEIGPVADQIQKYGFVQFLLYQYLEENPNNVYIPNIHR